MRLVLPLALTVLLAACTGLGSGTESAQPGDAIVASIGSEAMTLAEFERQYVRSLPDSAEPAADSLAEYQDFLKRYVDFRLKVTLADSAGYDTREDLRTEMAQYRSQLARPYLLEREVVEPLIEDLWAKKQEMVDVSHILLRLEPDAVPNDTVRAFQRLAGIVDSVGAGADFGAMAARYSEDPSAKTPNRPGYEGRLGFYSGGRMVKPFEDRMFATSVDSVSSIFRTQYGYHVLMVHARKDAQPERRIAHIMIQPRGQTAADSLDSATRLEEALARLVDGEDFADVAREASNDQQSATRGGDLDFLAYDGWLPAPLRDAAFSIDSVGVFVGPVQTQFGQHLVKLLAIRPLPSYEESYEGLKAEVARLPRSNNAEAEFAATIRAREGARTDTAWVNQLLGTSSPDSVLFSLTNNTAPPELLNRPVAFLGDSVYTAAQFGQFAAGYNAAREFSPQRRFQATLDAYLNDRAISFEVSALEARDDNFRQTMQEFRDGLMLFRLMEDSVWTAANTDSAALEAHYASNPQSYEYPDRTRILGIASSSDSLMQVVHGLLEAGTPYGAILDAYRTDSTSVVRFDTTFVAGETSSIYDQAMDLSRADFTPVLAYSGGRIVLVNDGIDPSRPKDFTEARAQVVSEYQEILETRLLERLRAEYSVRLYPDRLSTAFGRQPD
ncbi:MAG: peptidyl-prolyl cis-trans isomerase SurA [Rhodothermales bacterium]|jgi:peptidyl-prolyl cis-trans isomerase SurA